jgi:transposase-like protein
MVRKIKVKKEPNQEINRTFRSWHYSAHSSRVLVDVNRNTATKFYHKLRQIIANNIEDASMFAGEIEIDESYFGGRRKGKRGRGAAGKVPVFGLQDHVECDTYTQEDGDPIIKEFFGFALPKKVTYLWIKKEEIKKFSTIFGFPRT